MTDETKEKVIQEQTYRVPSRNLENLKIRIEKLAKRAAKIGVGTVSLEVMDYEDVPIKDEDGLPTGRVRRYYSVRVCGTTPKFDGWVFLGTIEHAGEAGNIVRGVPGAGELPREYRDAKPTCDHCQLSRMRAETFVLRHDDGAMKRVGRQCLRDFLGHADPQALAAFAQILIDAAGAGEAGEDDRDGEPGGHYSDLFDLEKVLRFTSAAIRVDGWMSRAKAEDFMREPTSGTVLRLITDPKFEHRELYALTDQDKRDATATLDWVKALPERADLNDYLYNLSVLGKQLTINQRAMGLACSMIATYLREQERDLYLAKERKTSNHVGTIGKRQDFALELLKAIEIDNDSRFGPSTLYKFTDVDGNRFTWFASGAYPLGDVMAGAEVKIKATVKKHDEYQGVKQTTLTRCKLLEYRNPEQENGADPLPTTENSEMALSIAS